MNDQNEKIQISCRKKIITDSPKKKKTPFSELVHNQLKTCRIGIRTMKMADISMATGINNETVRKMIGGQKPIKKRDFVIAVCISSSSVMVSCSRSSKLSLSVVKRGTSSSARGRSPSGPSSMGSRVTMEQPKFSGRTAETQLKRSRLSVVPRW